MIQLQHTGITMLNYFDFLSFTLFSVKSLNRYELLLVNQ